MAVAPAIPEQIGRYQIVKVLGRGGMAEVCLAKLSGPEGFSREVALKYILPEHAANAELVAMFLDEARIAAQFTHPNIVQIYDFGQADGRYFIAMEYARGISMRALGKKLYPTGLRFPDAVVAAIGSQVCNGLAHAHSRTNAEGKPLGIVHRDVTPENILLTEDGIVKVFDFGIAKAGEGRQQQATVFGTIKGKPSYMPIEQLSGEGLDGRADVYGLCASLWECVAGQRLFQGNEMIEVVKKVISEPARQLLSVAPDADPKLAAIIMTGLAQSKDQRPQAAELQRTFDDYLHGVGAANAQALVASMLKGELPPAKAARKAASVLSQATATRGPVGTPPPLGTPSPVSTPAPTPMPTGGTPRPLLDAKPDWMVSGVDELSDLMGVPTDRKSAAPTAPALVPLENLPPAKAAAPGVKSVNDSAELDLSAQQPASLKPLPMWAPPQRKTGEQPAAALRKTGELPLPQARKTGEHAAPKPAPAPLAPQPQLPVAPQAPTRLEPPGPARVSAQRPQQGMSLPLKLGLGGGALLMGGVVLAVVLSNSKPVETPPPVAKADPAASWPVQFDSEPPGAAISIDGKPTGLTTPAEVPVAGTVEHRLTLEREGFEPLNDTFVTLGPGKQLRPVLKQRSWAQIETEPSGAAVKRSGAVVVPSTPGRFEVVPGQLELVIEKEGFLPQTVDEVLREGANTVTVKLAPAAYLAITSDPSDAELVVDDVETRLRTPQPHYPVAAGADHTVLARKDGLSSALRTLKKPAAGKTLAVTMKIIDADRETAFVDKGALLKRLAAAKAEKVKLQKDVDRYFLKDAAKGAAAEARMAEVDEEIDNLSQQLRSAAQ